MLNGLHRQPGEDIRKLRGDDGELPRPLGRMLHNGDAVAVPVCHGFIPGRGTRTPRGMRG